MENEKSIPVGIYNKEIFIARIIDNKIVNFDVLRYVTASQLEDYRDFDNIREQCRELWVEAIKAGQTEDSLDDFTDSIIADTDMDDEENYPFKDWSDTDKVSDEQYEQANAFIEEEYGDTVGTWECSGCYPLTIDRYHEDGWYSDFKKFDYIFEDEEAQKYAKLYEKSVK